MRNYSDDEITRAVEDLLHDIDLGAQPFIDSSKVEDLARAMLDTAQYEKAERVVDYGMKLYPTFSELKLLKASAIIGQETRLDEAKLLLDELEVTLANNEEFNEQKGWFLFSLGDREKALFYFEKCLQIVTDYKDSADTYVLFDIGERLNEENLYEEALVYLKAYNRLEPNTDECLFNIAYAQSNLNMLDESIETYKKLLDIDPFFDSAWFNLGLVYTVKSEYEEALNALQMVISITPTYAEAYFNIGNVQKTLGDRLEAINSYTEYISLCDDDVAPDVYALIGDCWQGLGNFDFAERFANLCIEKDPSNITGMYLLSDVYMSQEKFAEAMNLFKAILKLDPDDAFVLYSIAFCNLRQGRFATARRYANKAIDIDHEMVSAWIVYFRSMSDQALPPKDRQSEAMCAISLAQYITDNQKSLCSDYEEIDSIKFLIGFANYLEGIGKKNDRKRKDGLTMLAQIAQNTPSVFQIGLAEPTIQFLTSRDDIIEIMDRFNIKL
ncbi:MAG: tetratricopeptide repeat protein [Marinilabiliaceae bacterium]|nr:tetratricopeptide repeat protein [Marinilabiliaceae bacterium]